jgi:hypothetical protein
MAPFGAEMGGKARARRKRHDWITVSLDRAYQEIAAEPIPEAWLALLARLDDDRPLGAGRDVKK